MSDGLALLFTRQYWLDEWHTLLVANRPTVSQLIGDLRNGSDFAPPFAHLSLWLLKGFTGSEELSPPIARSFTLLCTLAALWFVWVTLRRIFGRSASLAGVLAVATHAMVISYAFEARFYAPWLMFAAMFAWSLGLRSDRSRWLSGAIAAVGLCTAHWFGVVTLGLMCLGALASHPERSGGSAVVARLKRVAPAVAGLVVLALCLPLLLGQRASVQERSWVQELSWSQFAHLANTFWLAWVPVLAIAVIAIVWIIEKGRASRRQAEAGSAKRSSSAELTAVAGVRTRPFSIITRDSGIAALTALAAMPIALTVLSLMQPVMLDRYALTALLAWAPVVAIATQLLPNAARYVIVSVFLVVGLASLGGQVGIARQVNQIVERDQAILREHCRNSTIAFNTRLQMYYHTDFIRQHCPSARYLAISDEKLGRLYRGANERVQRQFRSENEFAEMHRRMYQFPRVIGSASLDSLDHFVVMTEPSTVPRDAAGRELLSLALFPGYRATPLNGNGTLYQRARQ